jgi:outer membrane protein insertion porin family
MRAQRPEYLPFRSLLIFLMLLFGGQSTANAQEFNVVDISVEGNKSASTTMIISAAGIRKGDQLTTSTVQDVTKRLYGLGFFKNVSIEARDVTGGINVIIKVVELPRLAGVEFKGNKKFKSKDLKEKLKIADGSYISDAFIFQKKREIIDLYTDKGYFLVKVEPEKTFSADSAQLHLTYNINEGSKVKVEKVVLTGTERVPAKELIGKMRNRPRGFLKSSDFDLEKFPEDKEKIIAYLHKKGYIDAYLKSDSTAIDSARNRMTVYLDLYEGPRYHFGKTDWKGNEIFDAKTLSRALKYKEGQAFNVDVFEESSYEIYFLYQEKGYLHVRVMDDRKTRDSLIDITFDLIEGLPSKVNLVKITGNTKTKEKVIRREISLKPGQVFNRSLMIRSVRDIMQLNYFGNVTPDLGDLPSGDVDVLINVEEKPTGQVSAGAGYSATDKFVGTFGIGIPNFRGMGQNLSLNVDIGSKRNSYSISFTEPWIFSTPTSLGADIYYTNRNWYDDYTEGRRGASMVIGRRLKWPDNYFKLYARYRYEDDRYYDFSDDYIQAHSDLITNYYYSGVGDTSLDSSSFSYGDPISGTLLDYNEQWLTSSGFQVTIERDSRNLPEFATSGSILSYSIEMAGDWLGGYWNYQKHMVEVAKFIPIFWKVALASKVSFGAISATAGDEKILESDRFSVGGVGYDGTIRGYDDGSLTPDTLATYDLTYRRFNGSDTIPDSTWKAVSDPFYTTVRGKYMLIGNMELQIPVVENQLYALLFFDIGNSWLNRKDIKLDDLYKGAGVGFRLTLGGIGTIGFDFGYPLDDRYGQEKSWHPHFQIGTTIR